MRTTRSLAAAIALAMVVTACGSSSKSKGSSATTTSVSTAKATGPEVKIMVMLDESEATNVFLPQAHDGANARVKRINDQGGLGKAHSPVKLDFCITSADANKTTACAQRAIDDKSIVAVAGSLSTAAETAKLFEQAGLPNIPGAAFLPETFASTTTFNVNSGVLFLAGAGSLTCKQGFKKVKELRNQLAASAQASALVSSAMKSYGCPGLVQSIDVSFTATDVSSEVTTSASGADAVTLDLVPSLNQQVFRARQQLGIKVPFFGTTASFTSETLKSLGSAADGAKVVGWYPTDDVASPGNTAFLNDLKALNKSASSGDIARSAWVPMDLVATASRDLATVDRTTLLSALKGLSGYDAGGLLPPLDFSKPGANPAFPRLVDLTVAPAVVQNGQLKADPDTPGFLPIFKS